MNELIKVDFDTQTVSARDLHEKLEIGTAFKDWMPRMIEYGFRENEDFNVLKFERVQIEGSREVKRTVTDYNISIDMAKQICMIQRSEIGKQIRQYFIDLEKAWNTPEQVMARALKIANQTIDSLHVEVKKLEADNEQMKPKAEFYDQVTDSRDAIDMKDCANVLNMGIGRNNLFKFLRKEKILTQNNRPYQEFIDRGYFRTVEQKYDRGYGEVGINIKTLVFQSGVDFIRKRLEERLKGGKENDA